MNVEELKKKLKSYKREDISIKYHAEIQAYIRGIDLEEVKNNILNPDKLVHVIQQQAKEKGEEKYDCYFAYSQYLCHRYILTVNSKVIIVTIIKINRDWQKMVGK